MHNAAHLKQYVLNISLTSEYLALGYETVYYSKYLIKLDAIKFVRVK